MSARILTAIAVCVFFVTGCAGRVRPAPVNSVHDAVMRFKGVLACNDCTAISADLSLYQDTQTGEPKGYVLSETYIDAPGGNFTTSSWGVWSKDLQPRPPVYRLIAKMASSTITASERAFELRNGALAPLDEHDSGHAHELKRVAPLAPVK